MEILGSSLANARTLAANWPTLRAVVKSRSGCRRVARLYTSPMPILRKAIVTDDPDDEQPHCSFCGKGPDAVAGLIEGADVCICSDCVEKSNELLAEDSDAEPIAEADRELDVDGAERPTFFR